MLNRGLVVVCDRAWSRDDVSIRSDDLEFTSQVYFNALQGALHRISDRVAVYESPKAFIDNIRSHRNDVVFTAIWSGRRSRNRKSLLPSICESYGISYVGADSYVQTVCQDKYLTKLLCSDYNIEIPRGRLIDSLSNLNELSLLDKYPVIVKPSMEGSSIGISDDSIADSLEDAILKTRRIIEDFHPLLVEEYVDGCEVSICLAGHSNDIFLCEAVELIVDGETDFHHQIWGLESKKGGKAKCDRRIVTNQIDESVLREAKRLFSDLGKVDYMRIDGRMYEGRFHLIELTPDCSLHPACFMAKAFEARGMNYDEMVEALASIGL